MIKLIRVPYGEKNTPSHLREYKRDGVGPVGCLDEWELAFPGTNFTIIDLISEGDSE